MDFEENHCYGLRSHSVDCLNNSMTDWCFPLWPFCRMCRFFAEDSHKHSDWLEHKSDTVVSNVEVESTYSMY